MSTANPTSDRSSRANERRIAAGRDQIRPDTSEQERMPRGLTPARIAALVAIALTIGGLAFLRFGSGPAAISVPMGAKAGDLTLHRCSYSTESGSYAADCGTLVVPENRATTQSRLIALPVIRVRARSQHPGEPIFRLTGGPGQSNMPFPQASRFAADHDVVLVGYRGVDGSSVLSCPEVVSALKSSSDLLAGATSQRFTQALRACADRLRRSGVDLAGYSLPERVDDLEAARTALRYQRIDLISESFGTRIAMIYAWRHPQSINRSVMFGVNPPGHFIWNPDVTDQQLRHYADLCAQDATCRARTDDLIASMRQTVAHMPERWLFLPIKPGNVRVTSFFGLMESTQSAAPISAAMTLDSWLSAVHGDPSGLWFQSFAADLLFPGLVVWGDVAASGAQDFQAANAYYAAGGDPGSILGNPGTDFMWSRGGVTQAWPANPAQDVYGRAQTSAIETLLVGGTVDFAAPPVNATNELQPYLPNGHQVVLAELGHATDFWHYQPTASTRLILTFLDSGRVDTSLYSHRTMTFSPDLTQTALAKGFLGTMVGVELIALLSLLWIAHRVQKRGAIGRKASAILRSAYPLVVGLGGWFTGALIVLTTLPSVPLDHPLLAVLAIGTPIGLGIYLAWVNRSQPTATRFEGFAAAMGGALLGAWLGFQATTDLLALITTIVGATVGANLALIVRDIQRTRSADRLTESILIDAQVRERVHA